jgi:hypothetical protein
MLDNITKFLYSYIMILMCFKHVGRSGFVQPENVIPSGVCLLHTCLSYFL